MSEKSSDTKAVIALIISVSSLIVSGLNYRQDFYYKEISIQPDVEPSGFHKRNTLELRNFGVGYAAIKNIGFGFDGVCISTEKGIAMSKFEAMRNKLKDAFSEEATNLYSERAQPGVILTSKTNLFKRFRNQIVISPNSDFFLLSFSIETDKSTPPKFYNKEMTNSKLEDDTWGNVIKRLSIEYEYCSITGASCFTTNNVISSKSCLP